MNVQMSEFHETPFAADFSASARDVWLSIKRGLAGHCPQCGKGRIFSSYLKVNERCPACGEEFFHHRADDAPPYLTILIVGHIVGALMLTVEEINADLPIWLHALVWPLLTLVLALVLLPILKGGLIAYQWALRMHGFETAGDNAEGMPRAERPAE